jgi:protein TonB
MPVYPPEAKAARVQGDVVLKISIDTLGNVESVQLVSGDPLLSGAATDAVKQWKFKPYILNGTPVAVETKATVKFTLVGQ